MLNYTRIPAPRVSLVDPQTGIVSNEWFRFFNNLYTIAYSSANAITPGSYGTIAKVPKITVNEFGNITSITELLIQLDATQITSGVINSARIQGNYTGITAVGLLTSGVWNATEISTSYGGTGLTSYTAGDLSYYASGTTLTKLPIGTSTYILTSSGTAPQWTNPATIAFGTASNLAGGLANQIPYQSAPNTTAFNAGLTFDGTNFTTTGNATAKAFIPSNSTIPTNGLFLPAANTLGFATNSVEHLRIDAAGNVSALAGTTGMTDGFFYIPSAAGAPTGTPTAITGHVPMYYDTTNNNFYVYNGAWKKILLI